MLSVILSYNPYLQHTSLCVDGQNWKSGFGRLGSFVVGQPMETWVAPYVRNYRCWNGILPELIGELNEDMLELSFRGTVEDYDILRKALENQSERVRSLGYSDSYWTLTCSEAYHPAEITSTLLKFTSSITAQAPTQHAMILLELSQQKMQEAAHYTVKDLRENYLNIRKALEYAVNYCENNALKKAPKWRVYLDELDKIMQGGT